MNKPGYAMRKKRLLRKSSAAEASSAINTDLQCPNCDRTFRTQIGLISHIEKEQYIIKSMFVSCCLFDARIISFYIKHNLFNRLHNL